MANAQEMMGHVRETYERKTAANSSCSGERNCRKHCGGDELERRFNT